MAGKSKIITFIGSERPDFAYHTANLLRNLNKEHHILVVDNSKKLELFRSIKSEDNSVAMQNRITYVYDRAFSFDAEEVFSYVIFNMGENYDKTIVENSDFIITTTDYTLSSLENMKLTINQIAESDFGNVLRVLFFNRCTSKIKERALLKTLPVKIIDPFIINSEESTNAGLILLEVNGNHSLSKMSKEYQDVIVNITMMITGNDSKKQIIKKIS